MLFFRQPGRLSTECATLTSGFHRDNLEGTDSGRVLDKDVEWDGHNLIKTFKCLDI